MEGLLAPPDPFSLDAWLVGLGWSLGLGTLTSPLVVWFVRRPEKYADGRRPRTKPSPWSGVWLGLAERLFFTVGAAVVAPQTVLPTMTAWIAAKMAAGWLYDRADRHNLPTKKERMSGLAGSMTSMAFALIGGLLIGQSLPATNS